MPPPFPHPSQQYIDNFIARRADPTPPRGGASSTPASPRGGGKAEQTTRIFTPLEDECPAQYYPSLHAVDPHVMQRTRTLLLRLCATQVVVSLALIYVTLASHFEHDATSELFTVAVSALCAFAACAGLVGVSARSRTMLLFLYINQLWCLSNVSAFGLQQLRSSEQLASTCRLHDAGELSSEQLADLHLDCDHQAAASRQVLVGVLLLLGLLWGSCYLAKTYAEMVQDAENDTDDRALVAFVWQRRAEMWTQLGRFEEVVQRQLDELRSSFAGTGGRHGALNALGSAAGTEPAPPMPRPPFLPPGCASGDTTALLGGASSVLGNGAESQATPPSLPFPTVLPIRNPRVN